MIHDPTSYLGVIKVELLICCSKTVNRIKSLQRRLNTTQLQGMVGTVPTPSPLFQPFISSLPKKEAPIPETLLHCDYK